MQKGENRNDLYVFNTVMCLLFTGTEINSNILLLIIFDFFTSHVELPTFVSNFKATVRQQTLPIVINLKVA